MLGPCASQGSHRIIIPACCAGFAYLHALNSPLEASPDHIYVQIVSHEVYYTASQTTSPLTTSHQARIKLKECGTSLPCRCCKCSYWPIHVPGTNEVISLVLCVLVVFPYKQAVMDTGGWWCCGHCFDRCWKTSL